MCRQNPSWGAPRVHGELLKLGIDIGETSVSKYMVRKGSPGRKRQSQKLAEQLRGPEHGHLWNDTFKSAAGR
jgi:hypothetical protein